MSCNTDPMLEAVRTIRPALESYYSALTDEQKIRLALAQRRMERPMGPHGMMGRWNEPPSRRSQQMGRDRDSTGSIQDDDEDDNTDD